MYWSICRQSYIVSTLFFHNFVTIRLDYLTIIFHMTTLKESFRGQRMATIPESLLAKYKDDSLIGLLFLRKIGYFPHAKYHHVKKNDGCSYALLIHCTDGEGWVEIFHKRITIHKHQYIIIPADTPYSFGTDNSNPWTIYWIHFCGKLINTFAPSLVEPRAKDVSPAESSRLQERTHIFEEIFSSFGLHTRIYGILIHVPLSLSGIFHIPRAIPWFPISSTYSPHSHWPHDALHEWKCITKPIPPGSIPIFSLFTIPYLCYLQQTDWDVTDKLFLKNQNTESLLLSWAFQSKNTWNSIDSRILRSGILLKIVS